MSIKAHRRKKASFKAFSFATYKGWSAFVAKRAAVRPATESVEQDGEDGTRALLSL